MANYKNIFQGGEMLFCRNRGSTTCCFHQHECAATWNKVDEKYLDKAIEYLKNKVTLVKWLKICKIPNRRLPEIMSCSMYCLLQQLLSKHGL